MLDKAQSETFLNRVRSVLSKELMNSTQVQRKVLLSTLGDLVQELGPDQITNEMIKGAWDVTTHLHPVDGSLRY